MAQRELFDFIVKYIEKLDKIHPHRIPPSCIILYAQRDLLLAFVQVFEGKAGQGDITIERISKDLKIACGMATISANYDLKEYFQKKESAKLGFRKPIVIDIRQGAGNTTLSFPSKTQMSYWKAANVKSPFSSEKKGYDVRILFQAPPEASSLEIKKQAE